MAVEITKDLPGHDLISKGLTDLDQGQMNTIEALLIAIGRPRLRNLGFSLPYQFPEAPEQICIESSATPMAMQPIHNTTL